MRCGDRDPRCLIPMKKALFVIAQKDFRDEEFLQPKAILEKAGIAVTVASKTTAQALGKFGACVVPDIPLAQADVADFDAVVFIGGSGSVQFWDDPQAHELARQAVRRKKLLAAICAAPVILARAGLLKGRKATVFADDAEEIKKEGAVYTGKDVEQDGDLITAAGPFAAKEFGEALVKALKK